MIRYLEIFGAVVGAAVVALATFSTFWFAFRDTPFGFRITIAVLAFGATAYLLWHFRDELWKRLVPALVVQGNDNIMAIFAKLIDEAERVWYLGALDQCKAELFTNLKAKADLNNRNLFVDILNTNASLYTACASRPILGKLIELDRASKLFNHSYYFYPQHCDTLVVRNKQGKVGSLLIFNDHDMPSHAIWIRDWSTFPNPNTHLDAAPPINLLEQARHVSSVSNGTRDFYKPLRRGWFEPVFPPIGHDAVRSAWRGAILDWFNMTAVDLCSKGGSSSQIRITWRLTKQSLRDAELFGVWLNKLKTDQKVKVERFMLVDVNLYNRDGDYRTDIEKICMRYLPEPPTDRYKVWYLDTSAISDANLNRDFALIEIDGTAYAQDSEPDTKGGIEVLRIFFSQDLDTVVTFRNHFVLLKNKPIHASLASLLNARTGTGGC